LDRHSSIIAIGRGFGQMRKAGNIYN